MAKWYVGLRDDSQELEIFSSMKKPTRSSHRQYERVVGPFSTPEDAKEWYDVLQPQRTAKRKGARTPVVIYDQILAIEAIKGGDSLFPLQVFRHDFDSPAKVIGLPDGSLRICGRKRLWKNFSYPRS